MHGSESSSELYQAIKNRRRLNSISMLEYALKYAQKGWRVIPLHTPKDNGECSCNKDCAKNNGKHPRTMRGLKDATTDAEKIRFWWECWRDANIGIVTGPESGFLVLDVDPRSGGNDSLQDLENEIGELPATLTSRTGGDGFHYLFVHSGEQIKNSSGKVGKGLDIKAKDGYIVAPPSLHASGKRYEWIDESAEIAPLPLWLSHLATDKVQKNKINRGGAKALDQSFAKSEDDFSTFEELNAELKRRIMSHDTAKMQNDGWWHCKGICHDGNGNSAIMFNPSTGAVKCMSGCSHSDLLQAFGLPVRPKNGSASFSAFSAFAASEEIKFPTLRSAALYGLAGDIVRTISPHSEADPAALLIQTLAAFGSCIGRSAYFSAEADRHYMNLFAVLVGASSKGRKGTSWGQVRRLFESIDAEWSSGCIQNGLSSGEGLIWSVRDPIEKQEPIKDKRIVTGYQTVTVDFGVEDKRCFVMEPEFASVLKVMSREGNTLSAIIRQAWDTGNLRVMAKNSPAQATDAHVSIIAHITKDELKRTLRETETANGFANRFLWVGVQRSKLLPEGGKLSDTELSPLIDKLHNALKWSSERGEIKRDDEARELWFEIYGDLSSGHTGLLGAITSRAEAQVMRLACVYALMDCSDIVRRVHLESALALWQYCEDSARYVFGDVSGDETEEKILNALREAAHDGLTQTQINGLFSGHKKAFELSGILQDLCERELVYSNEEKTVGRSIKRWFARTEAAKNDEEGG
jgi:hypothetical protein